MAPVRAVIFDFGGVLCFHPDEARWTRVAQTAGMPVSEVMGADYESLLSRLGRDE